MLTPARMTPRVKMRPASERGWTSPKPMVVRVITTIQKASKGVQPSMAT
jgi:hypothetical protein